MSNRFVHTTKLFSITLVTKERGLNELVMLALLSQHENPASDMPHFLK
jgi:hypothetical protein